MNKRIVLKKKSSLFKTVKVRRRFTLGFVSIVFPFFLISLGIFRFLSVNGIPLQKLAGPTIFPLIIGILCMVLGYVASYYMMNMIFSPLEKLSEASQQIARGDFDIQLDYNGKVTEIENTFENFNFMVQELNSVEIMRKDFIANVSHEFKTPLSSITGYVTLLQDSDLSEEERHEYIQMAFFNIEKLNDLTENILRLSKLENQNTMNLPETYRLDEQVREAIVLLEAKWNKKEILLDLDLNKTFYTGQKALLFQVWTNIIGNAIKFSDPGGSISVSIKDCNDCIEVVISDNGIGMTEETMSHIFEKFYQGDSSRKKQGNGLGLSLCKKILDICDGNIYVSSFPGKGSVFMVRLNR